MSSGQAGAGVPEVLNSPLAVFMRSKKYIKTSLLTVDELLAKLSLFVLAEKTSVLSFVFHELFQATEESDAGTMDPQQGITVEMFRAFVLYFKKHRYRFVQPKDVFGGCSPEGKCVLITFDDGYANNLRALPVLEEFKVPALFFISTNHVRYEKAFWWDVAYRELERRHYSHRQIQKEIARFKRWTTAQVEASLLSEFGTQALAPVGDVDRPLSVSELRRFAQHPLVHLGNHTKDHAILTNYSVGEVRGQIAGAQDALFEWTGQMPEAIAYPNGSVTPAIMNVAQQLGLGMGMLVTPGKNSFPIQRGSNEAMGLRRTILWGDLGIGPQCQVSRSDLSISRLLWGFKARASALA